MNVPQPREQQNQREAFTNDPIFQSLGQKMAYFLIAISLLRFSQGDLNGAGAELFYAFTSLTFAKTFETGNQYKLGYLYASIGLFAIGKVLDSNSDHPASFTETFNKLFP